MRLERYDASINKLAEGMTIRFELVKPPKTNQKGRKCELILHRLSIREALVTLTNYGSVVIDLTKDVRPMDLYRTGLNAKQRQVLSHALNTHRKHEYGTATT